MLENNILYCKKKGNYDILLLRNFPLCLFIRKDIKSMVGFRLVSQIAIALVSWTAVPNFRLLLTVFT